MLIGSIMLPVVGTLQTKDVACYSLVYMHMLRLACSWGAIATLPGGADWSARVLLLRWQHETQFPVVFSERSWHSYKYHTQFTFWIPKTCLRNVDVWAKGLKTAHALAPFFNKPWRGGMVPWTFTDVWCCPAWCSESFSLFLYEEFVRSLLECNAFSDVSSKTKDASSTVVITDGAPVYPRLCKDM